MGKSLRVIALISGGKDSLFSIMHCIANGQNVVALANLYPDGPSDAPEEIDSYMYQTVGHSVVPLYSEALGIPLYRQPIRGSAIDDSQSYGGTHPVGESDETESLVPLLERVKSVHPDADAICSGAILSTYQRTRIESVAVRLGLTPLAYLWQYPLLPTPHHASLLVDMEAAGMDARIIKVASGGLDESNLWMNVANKKSIARLQRDMSLFGQLCMGSVLGEGGEFETLAIDGPPPLWKRRIEVEYDVTRADGGVAAVRASHASLRDKTSGNAHVVRIPDIWDAESLALLEIEPDSQTATVMHAPMPALRSIGWIGRPGAVIENEDDISISNISSKIGGSIEAEMQSIASDLTRILQSRHVSPDDIVLTTIVLRTMADFASMNAIYAKLFRLPNPPARVTVAAGDLLPESKRLYLSVTASKKLRESRRGLHVQSRSYWAPANIGPYSQAIAYPLPQRDASREPSRLVHIAGQIPLVPASMEAHSGCFVEQAVLSLQHLWRIGRATNVHCWTSAIAYLAVTTATEGAERAAVCINLWERAHEASFKEVNNESEVDREDFDVGNLHLQRPWARQRAPISDEPQDMLVPIPDTTRITHATETDSSIKTGPLCLVAQVSELPKASPVEWVGQGLSLGRHENGQDVKACLRGEESRNSCTEADSETSFHCICFPLERKTDSSQEQAEILGHADKIIHCEAYVTGSLTEHDRAWLEDIKAQIIPCQRLWNRTGPLAFAARWKEQAT